MKEKYKMKEEKQPDLNMELGAQLFLQIEGTEIRIKSNLVGVLPQSCSLTLNWETHTILIESNPPPFKNIKCSEKDPSD